MMPKEIEIHCTQNQKWHAYKKEVNCQNEKEMLSETEASEEKGEDEGRDKGKEEEQQLKKKQRTEEEPDWEVPPFVGNPPSPVEKSMDPPETPTEELPNVMKYIGQLVQPNWKKSECKDAMNIDDVPETSLWIPMELKGIRVQDHLDLETKITSARHEPECSTDLASPIQCMEHLPGMQASATAKIQPRDSLKQILQTLGGVEEQRVHIMGARIANALLQNSTSWVAYNLASLYWQVEGEAEQAINCLRMALTFAPNLYKDILMVNLASVLQHTSYINDGILMTSSVLDRWPHFPEAHFTMANLHAAKADWSSAIMFYQSTLGQEKLFSPADLRLKAIFCHYENQKEI